MVEALAGEVDASSPDNAAPAQKISGIALSFHIGETMKAC
jgi:hypothetical protein